MPYSNIQLRSPWWLILACFSTVVVFSLLHIGEKEYIEVEIKKNADAYFASIKEENRASVEFVNNSYTDLSKVSLFEGVDIRIEGVQVGKIYFDKDNTNGIEAYNGKWEWDHNRIRLDPDLPNRGLPDFIMEAAGPN